mgnify:CR=1 FL=1|jgi:hypothetical protein|uniref:Uncharacterized protein n=1 Tax=Mus musculus TaxID=10090 RepID=Q8BGC6_MOUSE|nr:unnamed protein product [Mus musculus]BAC33421.1 unnamed protein product [Mus musculus]
MAVYSDLKRGPEKGQLHSNVNINMYTHRVSKLFLSLHICVHLSGLFPGATVLNLLKAKSFLALGTKHLVDVRLKMGNSYHLGSLQPLKQHQMKVIHTVKRLKC